MRLKNKVALITGGASGIGKASSLIFGREGAKVVVVDLKLDAAEATAKEIRDAGGEAAAFAADVSKGKDAEAMVAFAEKTFGQLNVIFNNAGVFFDDDTSVTETSEEVWDRVININLSGVLYGMRYQIPAMLQAGARNCAIVNMASIHGTVAAIGNGAYTAAKHGVVGLTKNAAAEYGPQGLRINCVGPAYIETPLLAGLSPAHNSATEPGDPCALSSKSPCSLQVYLVI